MKVYRWVSVGRVGRIVNLDSSEGGGQIHEPEYSVLGKKNFSDSLKIRDLLQQSKHNFQRKFL